MMTKFMKKIAIIAMSTVFISSILIGCGVTNKNENVKKSAKQNQTKKEEKYVDNSYVVSSEWLSKNLNKDNVLIIDARGEKDYNKGHIPGAVSVTWQQFSKMNGKPGDKNWGVVLNEDNLSEKLSKIGVNKDKTIVVYANAKEGWGEDGRIVWMLRMAGVENSKMLDGGWNYWLDNEYDVSKDNVQPKATKFKMDKLNKEWTIDTEQLKSDYDKLKVLDSRDKSEYDGAVKYGEARGGHLPKAKLLTFTDLLNEDGTFKSAEEMEKVFKSAGLNKDDKIVTYCTAGIRSAHLALTLKMMGYNNVKNYDESFYRWAAIEDLTVEK